MKVLLTGGAGYIGSHTAIVLSQLGYQVVLYDNLSNSCDAVLDKLGQISGRKMHFVHGDLRDTELLKKVLSSHDINAVIHFAGLKAITESVLSPIDYYSNNVQGTISLLQAMQSQRIKILVFSSSATVYGQPKYLPLDENHPTCVTNPYGRTKLHIEEMLGDIASSDPDWRIICLRYFNPIGAHQSGLIGECSNGVPNNLVPYILAVASGKYPHLDVFGDDYSTKDGTGIRDYIHVMDLAEGHHAAIEFLSCNTGWHAINLGTGTGYSVLEIVRAFEDTCGLSIPYKVKPRRVGDVAACFADPMKAKSALNWSSRYNLKDMCVSAWNFSKS